MSNTIDATERLLNLVIALLGTRRGYSKHYIQKNVSGYQDDKAVSDIKADGAFNRMFERDKDKLRDLGIPISTVTNYEFGLEDQTLYTIVPGDYRVPAIRLDDDAMAMVAVAANLWADAAFGEAAQSALRKVATLTGPASYDDDTTSQYRIRTQEPAFEPLWTALRNSRTVHFDYQAAATGPLQRRSVQPWGLGNKYGQWYLTGFDTDKQAQRNFRLSRIRSAVEVGGTESFERPDDFSVSSVLDDLGTGIPHTATLSVPPGAAQFLRRRAGSRVTGMENGREILAVNYREPELMADDLAAMGSVATVIEPPELLAAVSARLVSAATAAVTPPEDLALAVPATGAAARRQDTKDRLIRLLSMVPYLVAQDGVSPADIAQEFGITVAQVHKDLDKLMMCGLPGGMHGDLMDVRFSEDLVFIADAETLASPLRLSQEEACALLVGLEALTAIPGTQEATSLRSAIAAVQEVAGETGWVADAVALQLVSPQDLVLLAALQQMIADSQSCTIRYLVRRRDEVTERTIEPHRIFSIDSTWYVRAWCRSKEEMRSFRLDGIQSMENAGPQQVPLSDDSPLGGYTPGASDREVTVVADPLTGARLAPSYHAQVLELPSGNVALRFPVGDFATIPPLMARLGGHARVVAPPELVAATIAWLGDAAPSVDGHPTPSQGG